MQDVCVSGIAELLLYKLFYSIPIFVTTFVVMKKKTIYNHKIWAWISSLYRVSPCFSLSYVKNDAILVSLVYAERGEWDSEWESGIINRKTPYNWSYSLIYTARMDVGLNQKQNEKTLQCKCPSPEGEL